MDVDEAASVSGEDGLPHAKPRLHRPEHERGMVTAELAVAIPCLIAVLVVAMSALALGATQVALVDAARIGARCAARGDPPGRVAAAVRQVAPGSVVTIAEAGSLVEVTVQARAPAVLRALGLDDPSATARTPVESAVEAEP